MRKVLMFVFAMCLALFAVGAMAQTATTGSISGTVKDQNGGGVPNAGITVSGANLITAKTATTDDQGRFTVSALPPGENYTVTVAATGGFAAGTKEKNPPNLGEDSTHAINAQAPGAHGAANASADTGASVQRTHEP